MINIAQETLGFRRTGFSPVLTLLMSAFSLPMTPAALSNRLQRPTERSPTAPEGKPSGARVFGAPLEPRYIFRAGGLDQ